MFKDQMISRYIDMNKCMSVGMDGNGTRRCLKYILYENSGCVYAMLQLKIAYFLDSMDSSTRIYNESIMND